MTALAAMPLPLWLLVDAIATYRLTVLVTRDSFPPIKAFRDGVQRRWPSSAFAYLVGCAWCSSMWLAVLVVAARLLIPAPWSLLALVLAYSAVTGWVSDRD